MAECCINSKISCCITKIGAAVVLAALPFFTGIGNRRQLKALYSVISDLLNRVDKTSSVEVEVEIIKEEEHVIINHDNCVICLNQVCKGEKYRRLPGCNHGFHADCVEAWLKNRSTCPLCRSPASSSAVTGGFNKQSRIQCLLDALIISGIISLLNHLCTWFVNPLSFDLTTSESD